MLRLQSRILTDLMLETLVSEDVGRNSMTSQSPLVTQSASKCLIIGLCSLVSSAAQYSTGVLRYWCIYVSGIAVCPVSCYHSIESECGNNGNGMMMSE